MKNSHYVIATAATLVFAQCALGQDLNVTLSGFESNDGTAIIVLHNTEKYFPDDSDKAFKISRSSITDKKAETTFTDIPEGNYAIAAIHDENGNQELDKNIFGIPKEGVVVSGGSKANSGPPSFAESVFEFKDSQTIELVVEY